MGLDNMSGEDAIVIVYAKISIADLSWIKRLHRFRALRARYLTSETVFCVRSTHNLRNLLIHDKSVIKIF